MEQYKPIGKTLEEREQLFLNLYKKAFPLVAKYVSKMGGSFDEEKDVFQDALVIYYEKTASKSIELQTNEQAYLMGIAKHLWLKKFKDSLSYTPLDEVIGFDFTEVEDEQPSETKLLHYLETAGQKCMAI